MSTPSPAQGRTLTVTVKPQVGGAVGFDLTLSNPNKLNARPGEVVTWNFDNRSGKSMDLGIGNFQPLPGVAIPGEPKDTDPLDGNCVRKVPVDHTKIGKVECRVKANAIVNRTYKYDILDGTTRLLDPEIEIIP